MIENPKKFGEIVPEKILNPKIDSKKILQPKIRPKKSSLTGKFRKTPRKFHVINLRNQNSH